ncbi:MAG: tyrosine-type recombinase/integrase [Clostridia bacterium]
MDYILKLTEYKSYLINEEKSKNTIEKYLRDIKKFLDFIPEEIDIEKRVILDFKENLIENYKATSVNSILAAVNSFMDWLGLPQLKVKPIKIQREIFSNPEKELTQREYERLIKTAEKDGNRKLSLLIQTICSTGIRVSELKFINVQAVHTGRAFVSCKGKKRIVFLPKELCRVLKGFMREQNIKDGFIFRTKTGKALDRSNIWKMMKRLCKDARVKQSKVFPHNLRHLFARTYYKIEKDISRLADILGHSNINTTRIYTIESGNTHAKQIEKMKLVI